MRTREASSPPGQTDTPTVSKDTSRRDGKGPPQPRRPKRSHSHIGWIEGTLGDITGAIERGVFTEDIARRSGWLQRRDPRMKLVMFVLVVLAASLSTSFWALAGLYMVILLIALGSSVPFDFFVRRVWLGIPVFSGIVILPSIFLASGPRLFALTVAGLHVGPSIPGLTGAVIFIARVGVCVSLATLLILTTPWADLLKSLHALRVPQVFILLLSMTYRYLFLFLHTANGVFEARKSRVVGRVSGAQARRWISGSMASLMHRAFQMSNDVYAAMLARGFTGTIRSYTTFRLRFTDWLALAGAVIVATATILTGRYLS